MTHPWADAAARIYGEPYAAAYSDLYGRPWRAKHAFNARILGTLFDEIDAGARRMPRARWLDVACGQGWHLASAPDAIVPIGLDLSAAQLARARVNAPRARLVRADMSTPVLRDAGAALVTSFWAAYAYLDDPARIATWLDRLIEALEPGGRLYLEVLLPEDLASFNQSRFAKKSGFRVRARSEDWVRWAYDDVGGEHLMLSPPIEAFRERLEGRFERVEVQHDGSFMTHVVARGRVR